MYFDEAFIQAVIQVMDMRLFSSYNNTKISERFIELCNTLYSEYTDGYNRIISVSNCSYNFDESPFCVIFICFLFTAKARFQ